MKRIVTILGATALLALAASSAFAANQVRISQVYSAGGNTGATYKQKFVELFNSGNSAVNITGWALVYGSSTGVWNTTGGTTFTNSWVFPSATIQPCGYLLVSFLGTATIGADLTASITPDFQVITPTPVITMSGTNGKLMLAQSAPANGVLCGAEGGPGVSVTRGEEIMFRGFILSGLLAIGMKGKMTNVVTTVLFVLIHCVGWSFQGVLMHNLASTAWLSIALVSLIAGFIRIHSGSLRASILLHMGNNAFAGLFG